MIKTIIKKILINWVILFAVPVMFSLTSCYEGEGDLLDPAKGIDVQNNGDDSGTGSINPPTGFYTVVGAYNSFNNTYTVSFYWDYFTGIVQGFQLQVDINQDGTYDASEASDIVPYSSSTYAHILNLALTAGYSYSCRIRAGNISNYTYSDWVFGTIDTGAGTGYLYSSTINFSSDFGDIYGICIDTARNLYVPDSTYGYLRIINSPYTTYSSIGSFVDTRGVAVNSITGYKYVVSNVGSYVYVYSNLDTYMGTLAVTLSSPQDCAVDSGGYVYITDTGNNRIIKYNLGDNTWIQFGVGGTGAGEFNYPAGIEVDSSGNIYVCDTGNHRIQKFDSSGTYLTQWGYEGSGNGEFVEPRAIAIDGGNNVYIADSYNNRIQKFDSNGNYITQISVGYYVNGVAVTGEGTTVYACAGSYRRILVYNK